MWREDNNNWRLKYTASLSINLSQPKDLILMVCACFLINDVNDNICFSIQDIMKGRRVHFDQFLHVYCCSHTLTGNTVIWDQLQRKGLHLRLFEGLFYFAHDWSFVGHSTVLWLGHRWYSMWKMKVRDSYVLHALYFWKSQVCVRERYRRAESSRDVETSSWVEVIQFWICIGSFEKVVLLLAQWHTSNFLVSNIWQHFWVF